MTRYVYVLSDHEEPNAENACASLDRNQLVEALRATWPAPKSAADAISGPDDHGDAVARHIAYLDGCADALVDTLRRTDENLAEQKLHVLVAGGPIHLHVLPLWPLSDE